MANRRRARKNPSPPPVPPRRPTPKQLSSSLARVRRIAGSVNERERPFNPERPGSWRGSSRDLVVNGKRRMQRNGYELSFSPEFFLAEGEPYDGGPELPSKRPISVWSAIETMRMTKPDEWADLARDVFGLNNPDHLTSESVLEKVQETNTCANLSSPVKVYIDPEGYFQVRVYDDAQDYDRNGSQTIKGVRLDPFTRAFFETALWSSSDSDDDEPLDKNYSVSDIDTATVQKLSAECARFQEENAEDLAEFDDAIAGHDFWLTRCDHGAGFWDGDYPEPQASRLTKASKDFGNVDLYVGDDGVIYGAGYEPNARGQRRNGVTIPTFDWKQISGDSDPGGHGAIIARADGNSIELVEIQPVREFVGDGQAAEVGFPFWTREAYYDADDLSSSNKEVQSALESIGLDLDEVKPEHLAEAIAEALMRYGTGVEEAEGGWATDIVQFPVMWWSSKTPQTFEEFCGDEDDEFRREVLGEEDED